MLSGKSSLPLALALAVLSGCASSTDEIHTAYISPVIYQDYSCKQLGAEQARITRRVTDLGGAIDENATEDAVAMGLGLVLFWPALFFLDGDGPEAAEYGRLKGENEAVNKMSIQKECGLEFTNPDAEKHAGKE